MLRPVELLTALLILSLSWLILPCSLQSYSLEPTLKINPLFSDLSSLVSIVISSLLYSRTRNLRILSSCSSSGGVTYRSCAVDHLFSGVLFMLSYASHMSFQRAKSLLSHNIFKEFLTDSGNILSIIMCFLSTGTEGFSKSTLTCGTASSIPLTCWIKSLETCKSCIPCAYSYALLVTILHLLYSKIHHTKSYLR